jgi:hypothetical protein
MAILDQGYVRAAMGYWYHHVQSIMLAIGQYAEVRHSFPAPSRWLQTATMRLIVSGDTGS